MTVTAIQIGLDPDVIDCASPDFAQFPGLSTEKLRARWLEAKRYDAVLIGAGVRLAAGNTLLFESIVNAAHATQPDCRFVFNHAAVATPDDIRRWYPHPEVVAR